MTTLKQYLEHASDPTTDQADVLVIIVRAGDLTVPLPLPHVTEVRAISAEVEA